MNVHSRWLSSSTGMSHCSAYGDTEVGGVTLGSRAFLLPTPEDQSLPQLQAGFCILLMLGKHLTFSAAMVPSFD